MRNLSTQADDRTARTAAACAAQRAQALSRAGIAKVLELCVGPSLHVLETAYAAEGIEAWGNDIDPRWRAYYPAGRWLVGDAFEIFRHNGQEFDAVVFAPPLSRGCSGERADSLGVDQVVPRYDDFLHCVRDVGYVGHVVLTLPGRSWATRGDRAQYHRLLASMWASEVEAIPLVAGCRKYIDLHVRSRT